VSSIPPSAETGSIPRLDPAPLADPTPEGPESSRGLSGLRRRLPAALQNPVLRVLIASTFVHTLGRGVFLTVTVLYFSLIVGLTAAEVAIVLTAASAVGVATSFLGGFLADRLSARLLSIIAAAGSGLALMAYTLADSFVTTLVIACLVDGLMSAEHAIRGAIIARAFTGTERVSPRAILRTVTNVGIAVGSGAGGIALLISTPEAYRWTMLGAGAITAASALLLAKLPTSVDAHRPSAGETAERLSGLSPWRNPRYLAFTTLSGIFAIQFAVFEIGVPLWIIHDTDAPPAVVALLTFINTALVIAFQIPLSRGTHDLRYAGRVSFVAGILMAGACVLYFTASLTAAVATGAVLLVALVLHSFAEILSSASSWGLSFELADQRLAGSYQGVYSMGYSLGTMVAPLIVTGLAITHGLWGWLGLAALFVAAASGITAIASRAASRTP
jgi:MFS family permease